jgi:hypothetical protein
MSGESVVGIDANLPFGEVASRLSTLLKLPEEFPASGRLKLLELLRAGQLAAFVFFPGKTDLTVDIPTHYWKDVRTSRFSSVGPISLKKGEFLLDLYGPVRHLGLLRRDPNQYLQRAPNRRSALLRRRITHKPIQLLLLAS